MQDFVASAKVEGAFRISEPHIQPMQTLVALRGSFLYYGSSMQAFLASAKVQGAFTPPPSGPPLQLTQLDQCRIRDRSTIMARHLFADRGDAYADEQARSNIPLMPAGMMFMVPSMCRRWALCTRRQECIGAQQHVLTMQCIALWKILPAQLYGLAPEAGMLLICAPLCNWLS